ncbi:MAG: hypothetical protein ACYDAG_13915 [Chloroflexota bacterium]
MLVHHPASSLIILVLLVVCGLLGYQDFGTGFAGLGRPTSGGVVESALPPSPAAENFIKGQVTFNSSLMWQSFSSQLKQQLARQGRSQQYIQQQLDQLKKSGSTVEQVQYVGGVRIANGSKLFMYVLTKDAPGGQGLVETHYVLTVDPSDKIISVE